MAEETAGNRSLVEVVKDWPTSRKLSVVGVALLSLVFFTVIILQARTADYSLLFANLGSSDAATVVEWLGNRKIPYQLKDDGKAIYIPADKVHETRLQLAGEGLPQGGGVGFEIFDKQSFGMTDFTQKVNYRRALQGELARTIASLAPVEGARVHLAMPEKRLFKSEQQEPTASVIVKLTAGRQLSSAQVQGIINLVASSVEGLETEKVTVVDATGKVLSPSSSDSTDVNTTPGMLNHQLALEGRLEQRAQALLDRALGAGNSMVQVTAKIDFSKRERLEEIYDPTRTAVVSEQATEEKTGGVGSSTTGSGQANFEPLPQSYSSPASSRTEETTNYEVSKIINKLVEPTGMLQSLSVAVLVADKTVPAADGGEQTYEPRDAKELQALETMVRSALGLDEGRGDQISVVSLPFETEILVEPIPGPTTADEIRQYIPFIKYGLLALGALLTYLLLLRPLLNNLRPDKTRITPYRTVQELENELAGEPPLLNAPNDPAERLRRQLQSSQSSPTQVIKAWLQEN